MRARLVSCILATASCSRASVSMTDASNGWRDVPGAADFAEPGAKPVLLEVRRRPGAGCGGGGCSTGVETRALGLLPAKYASYFYPDDLRRRGARACPDAPELASLFAQWTAVAIAPAREHGGEHAGCGLGAVDDGAVSDWVILRIGPTNDL